MTHHTVPTTPIALEWFNYAQQLEQTPSDRLVIILRIFDNSLTPLVEFYVKCIKSSSTAPTMSELTSDELTLWLYMLSTIASSEGV